MGVGTFHSSETSSCYVMSLWEKNTHRWDDRRGNVTVFWCFNRDVERQQAIKCQQAAWKGANQSREVGGRSRWLAVSMRQRLAASHGATAEEEKQMRREARPAFWFTSPKNCWRISGSEPESSAKKEKKMREPGQGGATARDWQRGASWRVAGTVWSEEEEDVNREEKVWEEHLVFITLVFLSLLWKTNPIRGCREKHGTFKLSDVFISAHTSGGGGGKEGTTIKVHSSEGGGAAVEVTMEGKSWAEFLDDKVSETSPPSIRLFLHPELHLIKDGEPEATQPEATSSEEAGRRIFLWCFSSDPLTTSFPGRPLQTHTGVNRVFVYFFVHFWQLII